MISVNALMLVTLMIGAQDKPVGPPVSFKDILTCVQANKCKNMTKSSLNWYDLVGIPVMTFKSEGWTYGFRSDPSNELPGLRIYLTEPGSRRPSHSLTLDVTGRLFQAELGPQPGDSGPTRMSPEERAAWPRKHKVIDSPSLGNEFRPYWQKLADQALDAVRREISK